MNPDINPTNPMSAMPQPSTSRKGFWTLIVIILIIGIIAIAATYMWGASMSETQEIPKQSMTASTSSAHANVDINAVEDDLTIPDINLSSSKEYKDFEASTR